MAWGERRKRGVVGDEGVMWSVLSCGAVDCFRSIGGACSTVVAALFGG